MRKIFVLLLVILCVFLVSGCAYNPFDSFSWFEVAPIENTISLSVEADKDSDIYVSQNSSQWSKDFNVPWESDLIPVSCAFENLEAPAFYLENGSVAPDDYYINFEVWIKSESKGNDLKLSFDYNSDVPECFRIALVDVTNSSKTLNLFSPVGGITETLVGNRVSHLPFNKVTLKENIGDEIIHYMIYMYYEGQDPACDNSVAADNVSINLVFTVE